MPDICLLAHILGISILKTAESGRVTQLAVRGASRSDPAIYSLERTRTLFSLDSQLYMITTDADVYVSSYAVAPAGPTTSAVVSLPANSVPVKTQLGGKKVISASGVTSLETSNNKVTILGANGMIKSATLIPETYTFTGKGWGHAVGMSQEGAIGMGKAGIKYDQILTHYFQGTKIE